MFSQYTVVATVDSPPCQACLLYVLWTIFDQIFNGHCRHVGKYGIKFWSDFVQPLSRSGVLKKWSFFGEKYQYQAFPWRYFQFLKAKCRIGHVDKVVQLQKTRRLHTLLARFAKSRNFHIVCGWGGPRPNFRKNGRISPASWRNCAKFVSQVVQYICIVW